MSEDWYQDIVDFHRAFGHHIERKPKIPPWEVRDLRHTLISEEIKETLEALDQGDLTGLADGIADSIVVLLGTAVSSGINIRPIWDEVHKTNMAKIGGGKRADGKSLKPEGWQPPKVEELLIKQGME